MLQTMMPHFRSEPTPSFEALPESRDYRLLHGLIVLLPLFTGLEAALVYVCSSKPVPTGFSLCILMWMLPVLLLSLMRFGFRLVTKVSRSQQAIEAHEHHLEKAQESLTRFAQLIENSDEFVSLTNDQGEMFYLNPAGREMLGLPPEADLSTLQVEEFYPEETRARLREEALPAVEEFGRWEGEWRLKHGQEDKLLDLASSIFQVKDPQTQERLCLAMVQRDVTFETWLNTQLQQNIMVIQEQNVELEMQKMELQRANAQLATLATTDGLTGLKNHRTFQERLAEEFGRSVRYGSPLSLIFLDVDRFKQYNDSFGHPAGDAVLKRVSDALVHTARLSDVVARYGGEEFAIILTETDAQEAKIAAERLRSAIQNEPWTQRQVTASLGIATFGVETHDPATLIAQADESLYYAKQNGRNCSYHYLDIEPQRSVLNLTEVPLIQPLF